MIKTTDAARGRWKDILIQKGVEPRLLDGKGRPCPFCGGKDRFVFDNKQDKGTYFCRSCGWGDGLSFYQKLTGKNFKDSCKEIDQMIGVQQVQTYIEKPQKDPSIRLGKIFKGLRSIEGINPVSLYLRNRGVEAPSSDIFYHPELEYFTGGRRSLHPAMIALVRGDTGKPVTYHVTYLTPQGHKADLSPARKQLPGIGKANAIQLYPHGEILGIAEGIETAIAASMLHAIPVWSVLNEGGIKRFVVPKGVRELHIFADNDASFVGQLAAYTLAKELSNHLAARVHVPELVQSDYLDVLEANR